MIRAYFDAKGKNILVVGAESEIGQALIQQLLDAQAYVIGIDIQKNSGISNPRLYRYFMADPKDESQLSQIYSELKNQNSVLDGLVNLSGAITQFKKIADLSPEEWSDTYDISFLSCINACKIFSPLLQNAKQAAIVNMSSGLAFIGQPNYGPYSAAKAAIISLTKTLAAELAPSIRVNAIAPGAVDTAFLEKEDGSTRIDKESYRKMTLLGELAQANEVAKVILFLLSDASSHMTGQCLHVNGGSMF